MLAGAVGVRVMGAQCSAMGEEGSMSLPMVSRLIWVRDSGAGTGARGRGRRMRKMRESK